jgi:SRSO17 transposase/predicted flap endonuclease-1-like 5' DNA nuclease
LGEVGPQREHVELKRSCFDDLKQECLAKLRADFGESNCLVGASSLQTLGGSKRCLLIDCVLQSQGLQSHVHALERSAVPINRKSDSFIPIRCVLSNRITEHDKLLIAFDALVLSTISGEMPLFGKIVYGCEQRVVKAQLARLVEKVQAIVSEIAAQQEKRTHPQLILNKHCPECEFQPRCRQIAMEKDDLTLLPGMSEKERRKQNDRGIFTVTQLSYTYRPRRRPKRLASKLAKYSNALKALAIREGKVHVTGKPKLNTTVVDSGILWHHAPFTKEDMVSQTVNRKAVRSWSEQLDALDQRIAPHFSRSEVRRRAHDYLRGLLSGAERKNGWQLAEVAGNTTPYGLQHLLGRASWDADALREDLREYVIEHLADDEGVLIVDETGFIKKGERSVGVKRQYTGTAGKTENCQVGVFLAYASRGAQAFIDRELYLPEEWAHDQERRERAGVPQQIGMRTKPELAKEMLGRALAAGVKAAWVVSDSVYGDSRRLGMFLEEREQPYVLALSGKAHVWAGFYQHRVSMLLGSLRQGDSALEEAGGGWRRLSAGDGSKGPRLYEWLRLPLNPPMQEGFERGLLVRRSIEDPDELSAYTVFCGTATTLEELAKAAGSRWRVEIGFEEAKGEVGLSHYEVRSWHGWYRHITLALFAHAFLAAIRAKGIDIEPSQKGALGAAVVGGSESLGAFKRKRGLS